MIDRYLLKLRARHAVSAAQEKVLRDAVLEYRDYDSDRVVIRRAETLSVSTLLLDGLMCRYKDLKDGQRQISQLHVAGDFADLHSFTLKYLDHHVMTLTPCRVALVPHERLRAITESDPELTRILWFSTNLDAAIHREWELSLGRRSALSRVAHFFCEFEVRLGIVGLADEEGYALPLTQIDIAECLGLTPVHTNRMLKTLREQGLVEFRGGRVTMMNRDGLRRVAEFDPAYLYLPRLPG